MKRRVPTPPAIGFQAEVERPRNGEAVDRAASPTPLTPRLLLPLLAVLLLWLPAPARAQPAPAPTDAAPLDAAPTPTAAADPLDPLLRQLDAPDAATRERATRELMRSPELGDATLITALDRADSPEAAHRLRGVLRHRAIASMWADLPGGEGASLGLRHADAPPHAYPNQPLPGARVVATLPGFPAHAALRPGDVVVAVADAPLPADNTASAFTAAIERQPPRRPLSVTLIRDANRRRVVLDTAPKAALAKLLSSRVPLTLSGLYLQRLTDLEADLLERDPTPVELAAPAEAESW